MAWFLLDEDNDIELEFDDDVPEEEGLAWYEQSPLLSDANPYGYITNTDVVVGPGQLPPPKYVVDPELERSSILPVGYNPETGEKEWALPEFAADWAQGTYNVLGAIGGKHELTDEQFMDSAIMATLPVGVAQAPRKAAAGTFQSYMGAKDASRSKKYALKNAKQLLLEGKSPEEIYEKTGWWKSKDGEWLTEEFNTEFFKRKDTAVDKLFANGVPGEEITVKGKDVFPKGTPAYKNYKNAEITLKYDPKLHSAEGSVTASINKDKTKIYMAGSSVNNTKSALLHEIGHGFEKRAGISSGTSPSYFYDPHVTVKDMKEKDFVKGLSNQVKYNWDSKRDPIENLKSLKAKSIAFLDRKGIDPESDTASKVLKKVDEEIKYLDEVLESKPPRFMRYHENYGEDLARSQALREEKQFVGRPQKEYPWQETDSNSVHFDDWDEGAAEIYDRNYAEYIEEKKTNPKARLKPILPDSYGSVFD